MSVFRTIIRITPANERISLKSNIMTIGSCFSDAMGNKFQKMKFNCLANPFGVVYNPISIHKIINYGLKITTITSDSFLERDNIVFNYDFHSSIHGSDQETLTDSLNATISTAHTFIKNADYLIITYGTSFIYKRKDNSDVVANCHKVAASQFSKTLLSLDEIVSSFDLMLENLLLVNSKIKIILTVSPVRHIKDSIELNSVSKSILRLACHTLSEKHKYVEYFPAYEIMMDDLRDYRFYKSDMLHPNEDAEEYIWDKFAERYFTTDTIKILDDWNKVLSSLQHKPFHAHSAAHQQFLKSTLRKLDELGHLMNVSEEMENLKQQII